MGHKKLRSPLSEIPRLPGTYLRDRVLELAWYFSARTTIWFCLLVLMISEWRNYLNETTYSPWIITILFFSFTLYLLLYFPIILKEVNNCTQGLRGEVVVGQLFEGLRPYGYTPIHDIPCVGSNGKAFNIDHVLIGPKGIFVVETKTWGYLVGEEKIISFINNCLYAGTRARGEKDILQTRNNAQWLSSLIEKRTGNSCEVFSILTFPGWFIDQEATRVIRKKYGVYTLSPKAIGNYIGTFDTKFSDDQIRYFVKILSNYIYEQADKNLNN